MMMAQSRDGISENTEMPDMAVTNEGVRFAAAIGWGTLTGTLALMAAIFIQESASVPLVEFFAAMLIFSVFVAGFTFAGMLVIGLPITFALRGLGWEYGWLYAALGAISGFLILAILFDRPANATSEVLWFSAPGALAGFASALSWGLWREKRSAFRDQRSNHAPEKRDNPIHDLIH